MSRSMILVGSFLVVSAGGCAVRASAQRAPTTDARDLAGIERLHQQDVAATVPGDAKLLADTWTEDAVRINPGGRVDVGKAAIRAADERAEVRHPKGQVVTYVPVIKDVRVAGEWAFEWGTFSASYKETPTADLQLVHGTVLRVLRKQGDGTWKFARIMVQVQ